MSDLPVTMIAHFEIENAEGYRQYEKGFFPTLKRFNGEFLTFDDNKVLLEGDAPVNSRVVMFRFPSEIVANEWYNDPDYQALAQDRINNTKVVSLMMVHDIPARK